MLSTPYAVNLLEEINCGHSSVVERLVANEKVEGSNPFARSILNMDKLHNKNCTNWNKDTLPFDVNEIHKCLKQINNWNLKSNERIKFYLKKSFKFKNFTESHEFVNKVGLIAEQENHHPDIYFGWGYVEIEISTHVIKGLVESDFILAAKIDQI